MLYQHRDDREAFAFINTLIGYLQPPQGATMLDIACGKGRHSKALAEMGFDVTGIDLSHASIEEAKQDESDRLHFYQHDMRRTFRVHYYDYGFNFFTSFGYFNTRREHDNAIRTMAQSLKRTGTLVIDYLNVHYVEAGLEKAAIHTVDDVQFQITRWHDEAHFFKQIQVLDAGAHAPRHLYTERVAKFTLGDFTEMLAYQGLQIQEVFGDYQLGKYDLHHSPRMILLAKYR
jgi:SAM-dependent methyltransferase